MNEKSKILLDSCILIRYFKDEEGSDIIAQILDCIEKKKVEGYISVLTLTEIIYIIDRDLGKQSIQHVKDTIKAHLERLDVTEEIAELVADYKSKYHSKTLGGFPYIDGIIAATAEVHKIPLLTTDSDFKLNKL